jgi:hypothetical protein
MEAILIKEDLIDFVEKDKPTKSEDWDKKDRKARATIILGIGNDQLAIMKKSKTAKEAWESLCKHHEKESLFGKVHLFRRIFTLKLAEDGDMPSHLNEIDLLVDRLEAAGETIRTLIVVAMILSSLPASYDGLITALESRPETDLTLDYVKNKLIDEWKRRSENAEIGTQSALKIGLMNNMNRLVCYYCKKEGHLKRDCTLLKKKEDEKNEKQSRKEDAKLVSNMRTNFEDVCFVSGLKENASSFWFLDSGATSHMTWDESFFDRLEFFDGSILLANGERVECKGSGSGKLTISELGGSKTLGLENVLFVPGLHCNLISISTITEQGFQVLFGDGEFAILRNGLPVVQGRGRDKLFYFEGLPEDLMFMADNTVTDWNFEEIAGKCGKDFLLQSLEDVTGKFEVDSFGEMRILEGDETIVREKENLFVDEDWKLVKVQGNGDLLSNGQVAENYLSSDKIEDDVAFEDKLVKQENCQAQWTIIEKECWSKH